MTDFRLINMHFWCHNISFNIILYVFQYILSHETDKTKFYDQKWLFLEHCGKINESNLITLSFHTNTKTVLEYHNIFHHTISKLKENSLLKKALSRECLSKSNSLFNQVRFLSTFCFHFEICVKVLIIDIKVDTVGHSPSWIVSILSYINPILKNLHLKSIRDNHSYISITCG